MFPSTDLDFPKVFFIWHAIGIAGYEDNPVSEFSSDFGDFHVPKYFHNGGCPYMFI
jgi:hypothetical protein